MSFTSLKQSSFTGFILVGIYFFFFARALWEAITTCPGWFCDLGLFIVTLPWSLLFEPGHSLFVFDIPKPFGITLYLASALFFALNSLVFYFIGRLLGHFVGWSRKGLSS